MAEYLPEHKAPEPDKPEGDNYEPSEQEQKDIRLVEKCFTQAKRHKSKYDERWPDYYNMYRGKQWKEQRPSYRHSEVVNLIFREIQSTVPILMDTRPKFEYLPMEPGDLELAEILNQVCEADWTRYNWLNEVTECVYDGHIIGTGVAGMYFDQSKEMGLGAICLESEDPFFEFPSPGARNFNKKMTYHVTAKPMPIDQIKATWPNGKYVKADVINLARMDVGNKNDVQVRTPVEAATLADRSQQYEGSDPQEALVITLYLSGEYEIDEKAVEEKAEDGELNIKYVQYKKHPTGRKIVCANKVILETSENPDELGRVPKARVQNYVNQRQFWGISDVEQLESPQKVFNKMISFSLDVLTLMGNPIWKVGTAAGVDTENLFNTPGLVIEADDISQVQREEGVQLQPYVLQLIDRMKVWFDDVSGNSDVSRGATPNDVTAAAAIQSLQEAAQTRVRQKSRNLDTFLQDLGQLYASNVFQNYTAPRVFRLTNKDGSMKFFKFHVEKSEAGDRVVRYRPYEVNNEGKYFEGQEKVVAATGQLDVKVNTGTSLPFGKAMEESKAFNLFDRKIIDREEVLKRLDYPNWEAVLQRVQEQEAQMAEMAAAQGQPA